MTSPTNELSVACYPQLLYPLSDFYEHSNLVLPDAVSIEGVEVPEPQRRLLVHDRDMTPTLETAYGRTIHLQVLRYRQQGNTFSRQIVLIPEGRTTPVLCGAIKIYLDHFPAQARDMVLARILPFGTILRDQNIEHFNCPDAYLRIWTDATINHALGLTGNACLFGRRNVFWTSRARKLAEVLEILPPTNDDSPLSDEFLDTHSNDADEKQKVTYGFLASEIERLNAT